MTRSIVVHKKKDGTVTLDGTAPDKLLVSSRMLGQAVESGHISVEVVYHFESGDVRYGAVKVALGDPNNPNSPAVGFHIEKISDGTKKPAAKKKGK